MRDSRFQELVNAYLDGEISRAEEAALAGEIKGNPRRLAQFQEYQRLHGATIRVVAKTRPSACGFTHRSRARRHACLLATLPIAAASIVTAVTIVLLQPDTPPASPSPAEPANLLQGRANQTADGPSPLEVVAVKYQARSVRIPEDKKLFTRYVPYWVGAEHDSPVPLRSHRPVTHPLPFIGGESFAAPSPSASAVLEFPLEPTPSYGFRATLVSY